MAVTETITEPVFKHILRTNKSQKQNPVGELRTRHSGNSSHLLWTGGRKIDASVTVPALRPLAGQGSVGSASPRARTRLHARTRTHARFPRDGAGDGRQCVPQTEAPASPACAVRPCSTLCPWKGSLSQQWDGQAASVARAAGLRRRAGFQGPFVVHVLGHTCLPRHA